MRNSEIGRKVLGFWTQLLGKALNLNRSRWPESICVYRQNECLIVRSSERQVLVGMWVEVDNRSFGWGPRGSSKRRMKTMDEVDQPAVSSILAVEICPLSHICPSC